MIIIILLLSLLLLYVWFLFDILLIFGVKRRRLLHTIVSLRPNRCFHVNKMTYVRIYVMYNSCLKLKFPYADFATMSAIFLEEVSAKVHCPRTLLRT